MKKQIVAILAALFLLQMMPMYVYADETASEDSPVIYTGFSLYDPSDYPNNPPADVDTVEEKVDWIAEQCCATGITDPWYIALWLHNWLIYNAEYDYTYSNYDADGVLLKGIGVCDSYTKAYGLLLDKFGIESRRVVGIDHAWNLIKLNDQWCHVDCTHDDPGGYGAVSFQMFGRDDELMGGRYWEVDKYPASTSNEYYFENYKSLGPDTSWKFDESSGTLTISGTGFITHFSGLNTFLDTGDVLHIVIEEGVIGIEKSALAACENLKSITVPSSVMHIDPLALGKSDDAIDIYISDINAWCNSGGCSPLGGGSRLHILDAEGNEVTDVVLDTTVTSIRGDLFRGSGITSIEIPDTYTDTGFSGFRDCQSLTSITIPAGVTVIDPRTFNNCSSLASVTIPDTVTNIGGYAFEDCGSLNTIVLPDGITVLDYDVFSNCSNLQSISMPERLTEIGMGVFSFCDSLETIYFPASVTRIHSSAFYKSEKLSNIYYGGTQQQWEALDVNVSYRTTVHYEHTHDFTALPPKTVKPTCTERGYTEHFCVCGKVERTDYVNSLGHVRGGSAVVVAPTCASDGYTQFQCAQCGKEAHTDYINALGHGMGQWTTQRAATCTEAGVEQRGCSRCDYNESRVLFPGHSFEDLVIEPTCTQMGYRYTYCPVCDIQYLEEYLHPLDHDMDQWIITTEPTTVSYGEKTRFCQREGCDYFDTDSVSMIHDAEGWILEYGNWVFYENGEKVTGQWRKDSIGWCYLGGDGVMMTNTWIQDSQGWCYIGPDGYCETNCWKQNIYRWVYLNSEGSMTKNTWVLDGGKWYFLDEEGYMVTNQWRKDSIGWCYLGSDGAMKTNCWLMDSKGWCYIGADGYCETNCWKLDSYGWLYLDEEGSMTKNEWILDNGDWYYLDAEGYMVTNGEYYIDGDWYIFNAAGVWVA